MAMIRMGDRVIASETLHERASKGASGLLSLGIQPGERVGFVLRNDPVFFEVSQAIGRIGACPVAINWHSTAAELEYILGDSGAKAVVIHADLLAERREAIPDGVAILVVATPDAVCDTYRVDPVQAAVPAGLIDWSQWIEGFEPYPATAISSPVAMMYTSGTTGKPKGVIRQAFAPEEFAVMLGVVKRVFFGFSGEVPPPIVTAVVGPVYHGLPNAHANFAFALGADIVMTPRFDAEELLRDVERFGITHLALVPIMFSRLLKLAPEVRARYDLSSLRHVIHAAAPCAVPVKRAMIEWWGPIIHEYYGSTEMGNLTFARAEDWLNHPGTVGNVIDEAEVRILDDAGRALPIGEIGHVVGRQYGLPDFDYHADPAKRAAADKGGLIASGDIGYFDEDGFLYLCDRSNDMIISGGVNIYSAEIEAELHKLSDVEDCAVFGIPDDEFGESVCAVIQPAGGIEGDETAIREALRTTLSSYKIPRKIFFDGNLPREDSGKIFKRKIREKFWAQAERQI